MFWLGALSAGFFSLAGTVVLTVSGDLLKVFTAFKRSELRLGDSTFQVTRGRSSKGPNYVVSVTDGRHTRFVGGWAFAWSAHRASRRLQRKLLPPATSARPAGRADGAS